MTVTKESLEKFCEKDAAEYGLELGNSYSAKMQYLEGTKPLQDQVLKLYEAIVFYADGEGEVLDWDGVNKPGRIQDRGEYAREAIKQFESFIESGEGEK